MFTVRDALKIGELKRGKLVSGSLGLDNPISTVSVIEVPHATKWLKGNELFISAFYAILDNVESQLELIKNMYKYKAAGLVICHMGIWLKRLDQEVLDLSNELGVPIIIAPPNVAYADIIVPLLDELLKRETNKLKYCLKVQNELEKLILGGKEIHDLVIMLGDTINKGIAVFDVNNICISETNIPKEDIEILKNTARECLEMSFSRKDKNIEDNIFHIRTLNGKQYLFYSIVADKDYYGVIVILISKNGEKTLSNESLLVVKQASIAFALMFTKKKRMEQMEDVLKRDFLADLITWNFTNEKDVIIRARNIGWNLSDKHLLIIANIDNINNISSARNETFEDTNIYLKNRVYPLVVDLVKDENKENIIGLRSDTIVILLHSDKVSEELIGRAKKLGNKIIDLSYKVNLSITVGISNIFYCVNEIPQSYNEVTKAIKIGRKIYGNRKVILYNNLGFFTLLSKLANTCEWRDIQKSMLSKLYEYDKANNTELMLTFKYLLEYEEETSKVAEKLFIHNNTVLYRKERIIEILGYNPFENPYKLNFEIALLLDKLVK